MSIDASSRALHWVLKVGNLKKSLDFYQDVLGLSVLRHEEFESGCEATCNGPYGGAWSKTMVGYGPEKDNFALELTYNYGIDSYEFGNDLQYIALQSPSALIRASLFGKTVDGDIITGPDNYKYKILPLVSGRAEMFVATALRVASLENAKAYWISVLGLTEFPSTTFSDLKHKDPSTLLGFHESQTLLQLIEVADGQPVNHAHSAGRIAFSCESVHPYFDKVTASGDVVQVPPLTLHTEGKADVVVTILRDRDGYEICFVEGKAFYQLATPTYDVVDFTTRALRGGDGVTLAGEVVEQQQQQLEEQSVVHGSDVASDGVKYVSGTVTDMHCTTEINEMFQSGATVVLYFTASWCKNCKKMSPFVEEKAAFYAEKGVFLKVDIATEDDIAMVFGVSTIPRIMVYKDGREVDDYTGSNTAHVDGLLEKHMRGI